MHTLKTNAPDSAKGRGHPYIYLAEELSSLSGPLPKNNENDTQ
jgi:hypothetical protein